MNRILKTSNVVFILIFTVTWFLNNTSLIKIDLSDDFIVISCVSLFYDVPGGNVVDGLPPAASGAKHSSLCY